MIVEGGGGVACSKVPQGPAAPPALCNGFAFLCAWTEISTHPQLQLARSMEKSIFYSKTASAGTKIIFCRMSHVSI